MKKLVFISFSILLFLSFLGYGFFIKKSVNNEEHNDMNNNIDNSIDIKVKNRVEASNWKKITDYMYIDKDSIEKTKYSISAWFKMYDEDNRIDAIYGVPAYYKLIKYAAFCQDYSLCIDDKKVYVYDENNNLISDEEGYYGYWCVGPDGWPNGEIAYEALCKYEKDEE
ncbi:hypothetical protein IJ182_10940 [bacterium]|nr:hypothetical protein [bacterium]